MAVEDVLMPKAGKITDVTKDPGAVDSGSDPALWRKKTEAAQARRDFLAAEKEARDILKPEESSPFKIKGEVNLGSFDVQAERQRMEEKLEQERKENQARVEELAEKAQDSKEELEKMRTDNLVKEMTLRLDSLQRQIAEGGLNKNNRSFIDQVNEINEAAGVLGLTKITKSEAQSTPPDVLIALKKMDLEEASRDREFKWKIRQDEKTWALQLKQFDRDGVMEMAKIQIDREKNAMFSSLPETFGSAMARGLRDRRGGVAGRPSEPQQREHHLEAGVGEAGETTCPGCGKPIAVAKDAGQAVCLNCNTKYPITRIAKESAAAKEPAAPAPAPTEE